MVKICGAYRSPAGRVRSFNFCGSPVDGFDPGAEADAAWERLRKSGCPLYENAAWLDPLEVGETRDIVETQKQEPEKQLEQLELFQAGDNDAVR